MNKDEIVLPKEDIPKQFYNIAADLPVPLPPPMGDLSILGKIFPKEILRQEMSTERFIPIPEQVRELYSKIGRPTPLYRARRLEKALNTPAHIYFKREDTTFSGSHKLNTALAQAYYIAQEGFEHVTTETGAGQWGSALALASMFFGLECKVYMVRCSFDQKPYRKHIMAMYGAQVVSSPSTGTAAGRAILEKDPDCTGSLGIAISEAIEEAAQDPTTVYSLGSVLNHVLLHQTVLGQETQKQFEIAGEDPDFLIGCVGGGSNFSGFTFPFLRDVFAKRSDTRMIGVEPVEVPSMTKGEYRYDYGDTAKQTPLMKMHTLGCEYIPDPIYAGGLRYHGVAPLVSLLKERGFIEAEAYSQAECFEAARLFAKTEGIISAPESAHAIRSTIVHAMEAKKTGEKKVIAFNLSGHGLLDMDGYAKVLGLR
ncbi:MAG: TrpB-like pyridoxal phosphate-dependent enzyme [Candidatus Diapherotrites archaeon]|nr:TrpB-like pyridoxal phosphate-dependent enzyme [Candidatus Diapherotrites archaeon]